MKSRTRHCLSTLLTLAVCGGAVVPAMAGGVRSSAQTSVSSPFNPNYNPNVNPNYNPNVNPNYNPNVSPIYNPNALVNRNVPASTSPGGVTRGATSAVVEGGSEGGCCYEGERPAPTVAGLTIPAPAGGSIVASSPPDCTTVVVNQFVYRRCGTVWYQPQMTGTTTTWVVVDNPE
jgi:hypothetical protein